MSYENDLQSAWNRFVTMSAGDVIQTTDPQSAAYEPDFAAALGIIYQQKLFGWQDYANPAASNMSYIGNTSRVPYSGPTNLSFATKPGYVPTNSSARRASVVSVRVDPQKHACAAW